MTGSHLFEALKKDKQPMRTAGMGKQQNINFCLLFDEQGAFVEVQNEKGETVIADYHDYSGYVRSILKAIHAVMQRNNF